MLLVLLDGIYLFDLRTHDLHFHAALDAGYRGSRLESKVGPDGAFWISGVTHAGAGLLLRLARHGTLTRVTLEGATEPSGLGWSADGSEVFAVDLHDGRLGRWTFNPDTGQASRHVRFDAHGGTPAKPYGRAVDQNGAYWTCDILEGPSGETPGTTKRLCGSPCPLMPPPRAASVVPI